MAQHLIGGEDQTIRLGRREYSYSARKVCTLCVDRARGLARQAFRVHERDLRKCGSVPLGEARERQCPEFAACRVAPIEDDGGPVFVVVVVVTVRGVGRESDKAVVAVEISSGERGHGSGPGGQGWLFCLRLRCLGSLARTAKSTTRSQGRFRRKLTRGRESERRAVAPPTPAVARLLEPAPRQATRRGFGSGAPLGTFGAGRAQLQAQLPVDVWYCRFEEFRGRCGERPRHVARSACLKGGVSKEGKPSYTSFCFEFCWLVPK